jgi:hypothetical protein
MLPELTGCCAERSMRAPAFPPAPCTQHSRHHGNKMDCLGNLCKENARRICTPSNRLTLRYFFAQAPWLTV